MDVQSIVEAIRNDRVRVTEHADDEMQDDQLTYDEVYMSVVRGEVIEQYPEDYPYPSCLIYGDSFLGEPIHSVWAYNEESQWAVLITVYRPDPNLWIDWRVRRDKS